MALFKELSISLSKLGFSVICSKLFSLVTFYFVGRLLSPEQVGIYTIVLGSLGIILSNQSGSIGPILIERRALINGNFKEYAEYASFVNGIIVIIALLFITFSEKIAEYGLLIAAGMMLNAATSVGQTFHRAKLTSVLKFGSLARFDVMVSFVQTVIFCIAVIYLRDERAFAYPFFALTLLNLYLIYTYKYFQFPKYSSIKKIFPDGRYLIISTLFVHGSQLIPIFIVSSYEELTISGEFYFASQLVFSLGILAQKPLQSVILPMAKKFQETDRSLNDFSSAITKMVILLSSIVIVATLTLEDIVLFIWGNKWSGAASIVCIALMPMTSKIITTVSIGFLESKALWRRKTYVTFFEFFFVVCTCFTATYMFDNIMYIALSIFIGHTLAHLIIQITISKMLSIKFSGILVCQIILSIFILWNVV